MALLGVPFVVGSTRSLAAGSRISIGIVIGILFYLAERTLGQVALLYALPPTVMAVGPDLFILVLAIFALSRAR
jgi:lipopolysaccharide export system permease protein